MSSPFAVFVDDAATPATVVVAGELDIGTADRFRTAIFGLVDQGHRRLNVDLGALEFMDSTGLNVLVQVRKAVGDDGIVTLQDPTPVIRRLLEATDLDSLFTVS